MLQEKSVRGDIIKNSLYHLEFLDLAFQQGLVEYLEKRGNALDRNNFYTLEEIEIHLDAVFGNDVAKLIVERLRRVVDTVTMA